MKHKAKKASIVFTKILRVILAVIFKLKYRITGDNRALKDVPGPFVVLGNHVHNLDPFFVGIFVGQPIHYVASDEQFRRPLIGFLLTNLLGAIPKKKFVSDLETIKDIVRIYKAGGHIGIFPEGMRSWDGETMSTVSSTAKLLKMLKAPVVTVNIRGGHLTHPRWGNHDRRGRINVVFKYTLTPEELKTLSVEEIQERVNKAIYHNEYEYQKKLMLSFKGKKLAEKLELYLYTCPHCLEIGTLYSKNNNFSCKKCNYTVSFNKYGFFEKVSEALYFEHPGQWNKWQVQKLSENFQKAKLSQEPYTLLRDEGALVFVGARLKPLVKTFAGEIVMNKNGLFLVKDGIIEKTFELHKLSGVNVQYNNEFEFYYENQLYRFKFENPNISADKWNTALELGRTIFSHQVKSESSSVV